MKKHRSFQALFAGAFLLFGTSAFAGSATVAGTAGTNQTYIVIPEEYEGKEGQFVATATTTNSNHTDYGLPYISGQFAYIDLNYFGYSPIQYTLTTPSNASYTGSSKSLASLQKGSYRVNLTQNCNPSKSSYSLHSNSWASTQEQTFSDLTYYAKNGKLPSSPGITGIPSIGSPANQPSPFTTTDGLSITSTYIVVYGVDDVVDPPPSGGGGNGDVNINITTGTDDGVYTLIASLFSYISEMQNILTASDEAIRSDLGRYIIELQSAYLAADTQLAITIQNQINTLEALLSKDIADIRTSLEWQMANLQSQLNSIQSQQTGMLSDFYALKYELMLAIQQNSDQVESLSKELANKYEALVASNASLRENLLNEIAKIGVDYREADNALIADYSSKIANLQTLLQQSDAHLADNISALQSAYLLADTALRDNLELQLATLRNSMNDADQLTLNQITALERDMANADAALRADYNNQITNLERELSTEATAIRREIATLQSNYETAIANAKRSLEEQLLTQRIGLEAADRDIISQINALELAMLNADAELRADYRNQIANLERELSTEAAAIRKEMANLQSSYEANLQNTRQLLESEMATMQANLSAVDRETMNRITAAESAFNQALSAQKSDYENQIDNLNRTLSAEAAALRTEMANLSQSYRTEMNYLKDNLELQINNLKETTKSTTDNLQKQISELTLDYNSKIADLKSKYDAEIAALSAKSEASDAELKATMEAYVVALQAQMSAADEANRAILQAQLDNLSGAFDDRLKIVLAEYERRIEKVQRQIIDLESDTKTDLIRQKALLEKERECTLVNINKEYSERIKNIEKLLNDDPVKNDYYLAQIVALEKELMAKISAVNLQYQKQIVEIDRKLMELSTKSAAELMAELIALQTQRDIIEAALKSSDYAAKMAALSAGDEKNAEESKAELEAKIAVLQRELDALKVIGDLTIADILNKIQAGDAANKEELENLKIVLKLYCDTIKDGINERIASLEETISALQNALQERINTLENRLTYSLMTDEELAELEIAKQDKVNALANQIAGLEVAIDNYRKEGKDTSYLEVQLRSLTLEYDAAVKDLANLRYVIELRLTSELALHRKWIKELQELVAALQFTVNKQGETIERQEGEIKNLKDTIDNLEKAMERELKNLEDRLKEYVDTNLGDLALEFEEMKAQIETLRSNIITLATSAYSGYNSSSTGNNKSYDYSGTNKDTIKDDRDLRTGSDTSLNF